MATTVAKCRDRFHGDAQSQADESCSALNRKCRRFDSRRYGRGTDSTLLVDGVHILVVVSRSHRSSARYAFAELGELKENGVETCVINLSPCAHGASGLTYPRALSIGHVALGLLDSMLELGREFHFVFDDVVQPLANLSKLDLLKLA
jgi:hypothetical protein